MNNNKIGLSSEEELEIFCRFSITWFGKLIREHHIKEYKPCLMTEYDWWNDVDNTCYYISYDPFVLIEQKTRALLKQMGYLFTFQATWTGTFINFSTQ